MPGKKVISRKDKRKNARLDKKRRKAITFSSRSAPHASGTASEGKFETGLLNVRKKIKKVSSKIDAISNGGDSGNGLLQATKKQKKLNKKQEEYIRIHESINNSDGVDPEDVEIKRLEKLLGISGVDKKKAASKLDKEFAMYEGIGGNFGSFLMNLDSVGKRKANKAGIENDEDDDSDVEESIEVVPFLNDSDHEASDIEYDDDSDDDDNDNDIDNDNDDDNDDNDDNDDDNDDDDNDDNDDDDDDDNDNGKKTSKGVEPRLV